jgi:hypothetical protein
MSEMINMHKQLAMGKSPTVEAPGKGSMPKYAKGGKVKSGKMPGLMIAMAVPVKKPAGRGR